VKLLLVGCGKMGAALLKGWLDSGMVEAIDVIEPGRPADDLRNHPAVSVHTDIGTVEAGSRHDAVILAVKPQIMDAAVPAYAGWAGRSLFLSIAAGKTLGYFERHLGPAAAVVRAMPNTPAAVGRGITVAVPNALVVQEQRVLADRLLKAVGDVAWVEDEGLIDAVTAVSGGGPAYVFLLIEVLAQAGIAAGLPEELAKRLARATVSGSGELARLSQEPAHVLRQNVTSPGGTTLAALTILMGEQGIAPIFERAIAAATARSRELAG
jgi:pyrroline-5-carboxylate reductase